MRSPRYSAPVELSVSHLTAACPRRSPLPSHFSISWSGSSFSLLCHVRAVQFVDAH